MPPPPAAGVGAAEPPEPPEPPGEVREGEIGVAEAEAGWRMVGPSRGWLGTLLDSSLGRNRDMVDMVGRVWGVGCGV